MDGCGLVLDVAFVERLWHGMKHEDVQLKGCAAVPELLLGLMECFEPYNAERTNKSLV